MTSEVYNMDCMKYMPGIPDKYFDLAIVDPPYWLDNKSTTGSGKLKERVLNQGTIKRWDTCPPREYFDELFRVSKNQVIWGGNYFQLPRCRCFVCWDKVQPWENFSACEYAWTSFNLPSKIFRFDNRTGDKIHPTQKPVELYAYLLRLFARPGDKILDTHLGSGSSRIAAYRMGLDFYATEINKEYFDAQEDRFKRECLGEERLPDGRIVKQLSIFDL